ncbi:MAG: hypothetical protein GWN18_04915, partial [Thermoplasmata archaeon]|nr:hypothetical protein [Thermoplasmata archaeon]NIS11369.1 hypothetical protein [Thermoplasmata archaeon]NIS19307.1 hypothetical protein [Thermoplasmata archaeon]NIT76396.1 hypothetical protein [Thermoplasmata archaeon]NIU48435.1 hypothetical protein [Thermoplasmata archaeon]
VANRAPDGSFPLATPGAFNERCKGYSDAMLAKLDPNATRIEYCTLLGGDGAEEIIYDVEVDGEGNLHAAGSLAVGTNFTVTPDCHDP